MPMGRENSWLGPIFSINRAGMEENDPMVINTSPRPKLKKVSGRPVASAAGVLVVSALVLLARSHQLHFAHYAIRLVKGKRD
jgi:hypothetical protein